jgi:hypothetical protein
MNFLPVCSLIIFRDSFSYGTKGSIENSMLPGSAILYLATVFPGYSL